MREVRWLDAGLNLGAGYWALQVEGHQGRERRLPPLYLVRCLWEVRPAARNHQSGYVVHRVYWEYGDLLDLRKMVICACQLTR